LQVGGHDVQQVGVDDGVTRPSGSLATVWNRSFADDCACR
jgi:hypothetical protein